mgnify:FL=1
MAWVGRGTTFIGGERSPFAALGSLPTEQSEGGDDVRLVLSGVEKSYPYYFAQHEVPVVWM